MLWKRVWKKNGWKLTIGGHLFTVEFNHDLGKEILCRNDH